jgi:hypothetical protein
VNSSLQRNDRDEQAAASPSLRVVESDGLWCDDFDADLAKLVPGARDVLGPMADVELRTHSKPTNGKINCPSAWWTDRGLTAFFATRGGPAPAGYVTDDPIVSCTFWEAVRDEWCHDAAIVVDGRFVWKSPGHLMVALMYDVRGWHTLTTEAKAEAITGVWKSLGKARARLQAVVA